MAQAVVSSLARHGGNITDVSLDAGIEILGKTCRAVEMDALVVSDLEENFTYGRLIVDFANKNRMPTIYPNHYSPRADLARRSKNYEYPR
jgi:hypothetical protein